LRRKLSHDSTFRVYRDNIDGSFTIGRTSFKYNDKNMFIDGRKDKAIQGLWELRRTSWPEKNVVTFQDKEAYKQIHLV